MLKFDLARNAFRYIIRKYKIKEIYIPYYLCDVIRHTAFEENCKPVFYHIDDHFMPEAKFPPESYILYPNYFGICDNNVDKLLKIYPKLIIDNAHAFYAKPSGFASFNSERKFRNVKDGAYLFFKNESVEIIANKQRREVFDKYSKQYQTSNLLKIELRKDSIPFCYPFLASSIKEADSLVKELTAKGLTIYRYWNALPPSFNEYKFYSRLVPVPLG